MRWDSQRLNLKLMEVDNMERQIPNSLKEKYMNERIDLYHLLWKIDDAVSALSSGTVASYSLGNRSCTYQSLDQLKTLKAETEQRIDEIESYLRSASPRNITTSCFLDPSICIPRW